MAASYEQVVRETADEFVMAVAVYAAEAGIDPALVATYAMRDALARLQERGILGTSDDEGENDGS